MSKTITTEMNPALQAAKGKYLIANTISGVELGVYEGNTEAEALDAMARDAGYSDYAECCEVAPAREGEIVVTRVAA